MIMNTRDKEITDQPTGRLNHFDLKSNLTCNRYSKPVKDNIGLDIQNLCTGDTVVQ